MRNLGFWTGRRYPTRKQVEQAMEIYRTLPIGGSKVTEPQRVSDIIGCPYFPTPQVSVKDIEGAEFTMMEYQVREGRYGPESHILCAQDDRDVCVRTTSQVIIEQLEKIAPHLPLKGTFQVVEDRYFQLQ